MNTTQRGFIPLAIVVLLGIATIAGGTAVVISNQESKQETLVAVAPQEQPEDILEEVEKESPLETTVEQTTHPEANLDDVSTPTRQIKIDAKVKTICEDVDAEITEKKQDGEYTEDSLLGQIKVVCGELQEGVINIEQIERQEEMQRGIMEKWNLFEVSASAEQRAESHAESIKERIEDPRLSLIDSFLVNQTLGNLRDFCTKAKEFEGFNIVEEFNEDRTGYIERKETLAESLTSCMLVLGDAPGAEDYQWTTYEPAHLLPLDDDSESDSVRRQKISYNERIEQAKQHRIFGYNSAFASTNPLSPQDWAEHLLNKPSGRHIHIAKLIIIPGEEITLVRNRIWPN